MKKSKIYLNILILLFSPIICNGQHNIPNTCRNELKFEKTEYGLIFTNIKINDKDVKAMIDFGDQHKLQLSSGIIRELNIETVNAGYKVSDVFGNTWDLKKGTAHKLVVGSWEESNVEFTTQQGEMESVSQQIGTEFNAVLGWGYFSRYYTEIDYSASLFTLFYEKDSIDNAVFSVQFQKDANQLIIPATVNDQNVNFMIDTGSPVTVVDSVQLQEFDNELFKFEIGKQQFTIKAYHQDLSVLADLKVVCILGSDFLKNWKLIIDPEKNILHFKR